MGQIAIIDYISMYKALGGGWQIRIGKNFIPEEVTAKMEERYQSWKLCKFLSGSCHYENLFPLYAIP